MKLVTLMSFAMLAVSPNLVYAKAECDCSKECMEKCQKGDTKDCRCKQCDCAKTGKCSEGHCKTKK